MHGEGEPVSERLVRSDVVVGGNEGRGTSSAWRRRRLDLALVEVLVLKVLMKALHNTVGVRSLMARADVLQVGQARDDTARRRRS